MSAKPTEVAVIAAMEAEIEALARLDLDGLRRFWRGRYGVPPTIRSVDLLRHMLAWRIQSSVLGGLPAEVRQQLRRSGRTRAEGLELGVGTRIRREWQGRMVEVEVTAEGFRCDGVVHRSLSAAATAIAGTRWNGPRFFGLRASAS